MAVLKAVLIWLHLVAAVMAIGGVFFLRAILMPTARKDGCEHAPAFGDKVRARFRKMISHSIALLILTGVGMLWLLMRYSIQVGPTVTHTHTEGLGPGGTLTTMVTRWTSEWHQRSPINRHLLEAKIALALVLFAIAGYLLIPREPSDELRRRAPTLLLINLALGMAILALAAVRHVVP